MDLLKHIVYASDEMVMLIICLQGPSTDNDQLGESSVRAVTQVQNRSKGDPKEVAEFYIPTALLRSSSPVFASMLDGPRKESGEKAITITSFQPDTFRAFLDSLLHLANESSRSGDHLFFTPSVIRKVLPVPLLSSRRFEATDILHSPANHDTMPRQ
jgi:hypothetical protein